MTTLPQDKARYTLADKAIRQTQCKTRFTNNSVIVEIRIKGVDTELVQLAASYREGQVLAVTTLKSKYPVLSNLPSAALDAVGTVKDSEVVLEEAGFASYTLRLSIPFKNPVTLVGADKPTETKRVTWHERSCQYQYPLERYAGKIDGSHAESAYADAGKFETWKNENGTDQALYNDFKIKNGDEEEELENRTLDLAKKQFAGIQAVERYYPEVVRISEYKWIEGDDEEVEKSIINHLDETPDLAKIDDATPNAVWSQKFPNTSWLKVGYDVQTSPTALEGFWDATVTETWRGVDKSDNQSGWDKNLYGESDRWKFYNVTIPEVNNQNNSNNNQGG